MFAPCCLLAFLGLVATARAEPPQRYTAGREAMGTRFDIVVYSTDADQARRGLEAAFARIAELDTILSDYAPESELSRLSAAAPTREPRELGADLRRVLTASLEYSAASDGAFDVTVGPLTTLWRRARRQRELPAPEALAAAREAVGWRRLRVAEAGASLERPGMRLDLGGIAKGYALDEALATLRRAGLPRALINGGGDVLAGDPPPDKEGWRIGVAPLEPRAEPSRVLLLANRAVATSGDAWQFVELDGKRYSHIVDPRTGLGLTRRSSVTVVAPTGMEADALATAVSVLGPDRGLELVERRPDVAAVVVELDERQQPVTRVSAGLDSLTAPATAR